MPHVLIAGKMHPAGLALIEAAPGFSFDYVEAITEASYAPRVGEADALILRTQPLTAQTIAQAARLKLVSRHGVGTDSVDIAALNARRIPLCVVGDTNSQSVAEHAMMLFLACAKQALARRPRRAQRRLGLAQPAGGGRGLGQTPADPGVRPLGPAPRAHGARL